MASGRDNGEHAVSDGERTVGVSLDAGHDLAERLPLYGFAAEDEPAAEYSTGIPTLHFILAALRRSKWLWCATAVVGLVLGVGIFVTHPPPFKASTSVVLVPNPDELPTDAILTDVALAQSRNVAERAMRQLGLPQSGQSVSSFLGGYAVTAVTDRVLVITVKAPSSSEAVARAGALATAFLQFRAQQAQSEEQHVLAALQQQITQAKQDIKSLSNEVARLQTLPSAQQGKLASVRAQLSQATSQLPTLQRTVTGSQVSARLSANQLVRGSTVLDRAAPIAHSRFKLPALYAIGGLVAGLVLGMGFVVVRELVSDRLRRRDDVAHALGAPVRLSVGTVRLGGLLGRRGLAAAESDGIRRIVAHLREVVPGNSKRVATLAVVAVDWADVAALSAVSLAVSVAAEGKRVVLADLCSSAPAAALAGVKERGVVRGVTVKGAQLVVAVPGRDGVAPVGPLRRGPAAAGQRPSRELMAACESADFLLTLARLDPSVGGDHLATWASDVVVMVTAGQASWTKIHAVGEMIRLAGMRLASAVLVGADKTDESLGATHTPTPPAPVDVR
jgi:capsular polysaccharide biosynthesis protein